MPMASEVVVVTTTLPRSMSEEEVDEFAKRLVENHLSACVQRSRIESTYVWEEETCSEQEWRLDIKTSKRRLKVLLDRLKQAHPHNEPQIIHRVHQASDGYSNWVNGATGD